MESNVKITKNPKTGEVFTPNANLGKDGKQYGFIRVESKEIDMSSAVARVKTRSALKTMLAEDFAKVKGVLTDGTSLPGRIRVIETIDAEEAKKKGYKAKMAGSDANAQPCTIDGNQIFRGTEYDPSGELADELIQHNNVIVGSTVASKSEGLNA